MIKSNDKFVMLKIRDIINNMINNKIKGIIKKKIRIIKEPPDTFLIRVVIRREEVRVKGKS